MKAVYFSPLPPERSGIADYSALLLPALSRRLDVVVARRGRRRAGRAADVALYHVGNDPASHGWIVEALRARPGVVVLHDWVLHHLVAGLTLARRDVASYLEAMERDAGLVDRLLGLGVVDGCVPPLWEDRPERFPLAAFVLEQTHDVGVIVHSRYVEERVRSSGYRGPVWRIPHPAWPAPAVEPADLGPGPVVGSLGNLNLDKRIPQLLAAFVLLRERVPDARLLLVGSATDRLDLDARLRSLELPEGAIIREPYADEPRLWSLLARCDVCVSLRSPTMGETSGVAIRALSRGTPLVVSDAGWFAELPGEVALRVPADEREIERLAATLELLVTQEDARRALGDAGRAYAAREHDVDRVAGLYAAALEEAAGGPAVGGAVSREVGAAAAEVGIAPGSEDAAELAARLRETDVVRSS